MHTVFFTCAFVCMRALVLSVVSTSWTTNMYLGEGKTITDNLF